MIFSHIDFIIARLQNVTIATTNTFPSRIPFYCYKSLNGFAQEISVSISTADVPVVLVSSLGDITNPNSHKHNTAISTTPSAQRIEETEI